MPINADRILLVTDAIWILLLLFELPKYSSKTICPASRITMPSVFSYSFRTVSYTHLYKYEGELHYEGMEYDFEIDANTGTFLEWTEEKQDEIFD